MKKGILGIWIMLWILCAARIPVQAEEPQTELPAGEQVVTEDDPSMFIKEGGLPEPADEEAEACVRRERFMLARDGSGAVLTDFDTYLSGQMSAMKTVIDVSMYKISRSSIYSAFAAVLNRHPELYFVDTEIGVHYGEATEEVTRLDISYLDYDREQVEAEMNRTIAGLAAGMSDLEKVIAIHDFLCVDVTYPYEDSVNGTLGPDVHNVKGAVIDKSAVCDGYATAFQYYMHKLNIPCNIVTGGNHAWNQVQVDGKWYMVDVTFDDPVQDWYGRAEHKYLMKSDTGIADDDHVWDPAGYEACEDTSYDAAFWTASKTQMIYHGGYWYMAGTDKLLYKHNFTEHAITSPGIYVATFDAYWYVYGNPEKYYSGNFGRLATRYGKLIYSMPDRISLCEFDGSGRMDIKGIDTADGYIYGMRLVGDDIQYQLSKVPKEGVDRTETTRISGLLDLADGSIDLMENSVQYNGSEQYSAATVYYGGEELREGTDYTVEYAYPESGTGMVTVSVTGAGAFCGTNTKQYEITRLLQTVQLSQTELTCTYGASPAQIRATVSGGRLQYHSGDETVAVVDESGKVTAAGVGTAVITVSTEGDFHYGAAEASLSIRVTQAQLPYTGSVAGNPFVYTGMDMEPQVVVDDLVNGRDYQIIGYENNRNAANQNAQTAPTVLIEGIGNYTGSRKIYFTIEKAEPGEPADGPQLQTIHYGQKLSDSLVQADGTAWFGQSKVEGSFQFVDASVKPTVTGQKQFAMLFTPSSANFKSKTYEIQVTVLPYGNAPLLPESVRTVEYSVKTVAEVSLPLGWEWSAASKEIALAPGEAVEVLAVYTGSDAGNYAVESQKVSITRSVCLHASKERRSTVAVTCGADGYTGDLYCLVCGELLEQGTVVAATGKHHYDNGAVLVEPTTTSEGRKRFTCVDCGATEDMVLEKLPEVVRAKQTLSVAAASIIKAYGSEPFPLGVTAQGGPLSYESDDEGIVKVDSQGMVSVLDVGTAHIHVYTEGDTRYLPAETNVTVTVQPISLPDTAALSASEYVYTGREICPEVVFSGLEKDTDYQVAYENHVNVGAAGAANAPAAVVTGCGHYTGQIRLPFSITKAQLGSLAAEPAINELYYGQPLKNSFTDTVGAAWFGSTKVAGSFRFAEPDLVPNVKDAQEHEVIFVPDSGNYQEKSIQVKVKVLPYGTAPGLAASLRTVEYQQDTVGKVMLPQHWSWKEGYAEQALAVGKAVEAVAVYTGEDADNYEVTQQMIGITRLACVHDLTEKRNEKAADCGNPGYTGDVFCTVCGECVTRGAELPATGTHAWDDGVQQDERTMRYTCTVCGQTTETPIGQKPSSDPAAGTEQTTQESTQESPNSTGTTEKAVWERMSEGSGFPGAQGQNSTQQAAMTETPATEERETIPATEETDAATTEQDATEEKDVTTEQGTTTQQVQSSETPQPKTESPAAREQAATASATRKEQTTQAATEKAAPKTETPATEQVTTEGQDTAASKNSPTVLNIKNKAFCRVSFKVKIKDADGIRKVVLNGKTIKNKYKKKTLSFKLSKYRKYLKKNGKWNKLTVTDARGKKKTVKFKLK